MIDNTCCEGEGKVGWGPFSLDVKVHGSVSSKSEHTRTSDNSAKYDVKVIARDDGMPEGLKRVLDMLNTAIAPTSVPAPAAAPAQLPPPKKSTKTKA